MALASNLATKLGYGKAGHINTAIEEGKLDARDLIFTSDTHELKFIDDELNVLDLTVRKLRFDNIESALAKVNSSLEAYSGQTIMIRDENGKYSSYLVQDDPNNEGKFIIEKEDIHLKWDEF